MKALMATVMLLAAQARAYEPEDTPTSEPPVIYQVVAGHVLARDTDTGKILGDVEVGRGTFMNESFTIALDQGIERIRQERDSKPGFVALAVAAGFCLLAGFGAGVVLVH